MDLTTTEIVILVPFLTIMGSSAITSFFMDFMKYPAVQAFVNATSLFFKNTEVVWRPALEFALTVTKPMHGFALATLKMTFKWIVLATINILQFGEMCMNMTSSFLVATKDFAVSLGTVTKALASLFVNAVHAFSYVVKSFEDVNVFLYRALFESHTVSWNDIYNISVPFLVVLSILGYLTYKANRLFSFSSSTKTDEEPFIPRRSSRLAKKRAMLHSDHLGSLVPAC